MSYLINAARPVSLTIGGTDYISNLVDFQLSDSSGYRNGIITSSGTIRLATNPGESFEDYDRNDFKRGTQITLDITYPDGTTSRHPRGLLYVISTSYSPEEETVLLDVGCYLAMKKLLDNEDDIEALIDQYADIPLDPAQRDFESLSSSIAAATKVMWADETGGINKDLYFAGDGYGTYASGAFVSVRGVTALTIQPLAAAAAIPDSIELSYSYPEDEIATDNQGRIDTTTTESNYFLRYPAITFERQAPDGPLSGNVSLKIPPVQIPPIPIPTSGCGNTPSPPQYKPSTSVGGGTIGGGFTIAVPSACSQNYETKSVTTYVPAKRREIRRSIYAGPGAQLSATESYIYGPALEANSQYFADKYAYCVGTYANQCLPNGGCELEGLFEMQLGRQNTTYEYGSGNEVIKTTTSTFRPTIAAAQPDDWRSGSNRGIPQDFNQDLSTTKEYLHQVVIREFFRENNENVSNTTTFTSTASRGGGIGAAIDAYKGIKTTETRRSTSNVTKDLRPDSVNSATTAVETEVTTVQMHGKVGGYTGGYGPFVIKEDMPVPLLFDSKSEVDSAVNAYGDYLARFIEGDSRGLVIAEALRKDIATNWKPNVSFRYYDPITDKLMGFRADACTWGADQGGCVVVINGIWVADMTGTVDMGSNLVGNSTPDMSGAKDPTPPTHDVPRPPRPPVTDDPVVNPDPPEDPTVTDDVVTGKRFNFHVNVDLSIEVLMNLSGENGLRPIFERRQDVVINESIIVWCTARIIQPGALVTLELNGSIPLTDVGNPIVDDQLIIQEDIFGTSNDP